MKRPQSPRKASGRSWRHLALACGAAAALALALHAAALDNPAIPHDAPGLHLPHAAGIRFPLTAGAVLAWLSHGLTSALVVLLVTRLSGRPFAGLAAGLIFAAHPVNVEAIGWSEARSVPVAALIALSASVVWWWESERARARAQRTALKVLAALAVVGAAFIHPAAAAAPICVWAAVEIRGRGERNSYLSAVKHGSFAIVAVVAAFFGPVARMPGQFPGVGFVDALGALVVPWRLLPDYRLLYAKWTPLASMLVFFGVMAALAVAAWILNRRFPAARAGLACFFSASLVASVFGVFRADHALYLALLCIAWPAAEALALLPRKIAAGVLVVVLVLFGAKTILQHRTWDSPKGVLMTLFRGAPARGQLSVAERLLERGEYKERKAVGLDLRAKRLEDEGRRDAARAVLADASVLHRQASDLFSLCVSAVLDAEEVLDPDDGELLAARGLVALRQRDYSAARPLLERAIEKTDPGQARARLLVSLGGLLEHEVGRRRSMELYEEAIEDDPSDPLALFFLGSAYRLKGGSENYGKALALFRRAVKAGAGDAEFQNRMGYVFMEMLRRKDAFEAFKKAVELDPANRRFRDDLDIIRRIIDGGKRNTGLALRALARGEALDEQEMFLSAAKEYAKAIAHERSNPVAHFRRGVSLAREAMRPGRYKYEARRSLLTEALDHFEAALIFSPGNEGYMFALAQANCDLGRADEAESVLKKILASNPRSGRAHLRLARIHAYVREDVELARYHIEKARGLGVKPSPEFLAEVADIELGEPTEKEKKAEEAYEAASGEAEVFAEMKELPSAAAAYARAGEALAGLERPSLVLKRALAAAKAGHSWQKAGDLARALEWYRKAAGLVPGRYDRAIERVKGLIQEDSGEKGDERGDRSGGEGEDAAGGG